MSQNRTVRALLVDPKRKAVDEVAFLIQDGHGMLSEYLDQDCEPGIMPEAAIRFDRHPFPLWSKGHVLYVDEEGKLKGKSHHFRFKFGAIPVLHTWQWLTGMGLIVNHGPDDGYHDHTMDVDFLRESLEFMKGTQKVPKAKTGRRRKK